MHALRRSTRTTLALLAGGVLMTNGCVISHYVPHARVSPSQYCPNDTLIASYDITRRETCVSRDRADCADLAPEYLLSIDPPLEPDVTIRGYTGSRAFAPNGGPVAVTFTPNSESLAYPIVNSAGDERWAARWIRREVHRSEPLIGETSASLNHTGMCSGETPVNAPVVLGGLSNISGRMVVERVCNTDSVPMVVTANGGPGGPSASQMLPSGGCLPLGWPAAPTTVSVVAPFAPETRCSAVQGSTPPRTVQTTAFIRCGN